jgi:hypothetical protein
MQLFTTFQRQSKPLDATVIGNAVARFIYFCLFSLYCIATEPVVDRVK